MLAIHPDHVEGAYRFLKMFPPFRGWKLPDADDLIFSVSGNMKTCGHYDEVRREIRVSQNLIGTTEELLKCVAHEMIHVYEHRQYGSRYRGNHGPWFYARVKTVCKYLRWDPKAL